MDYNFIYHAMNIYDSNKYAPQMPQIYPISQLLHMQILDNHVCISSWYELNAMKKSDHDH